MLRVSIVCFTFTIFLSSSAVQNLFQTEEEKSLIVDYDKYNVQVDKSFNITSLLEKMNYYRALHDAQPLELDEGMSGVALERAKNLTIGPWQAIDEQYGETDYGIDGKYNEHHVLPYEEPANDWYQAGMPHWLQTGGGYNFEEEPDDVDFPRSKKRYFTQLLWRKSKRVGIAAARSYSYYRLHLKVVCYYDPKGNIKGEFRENVRKELKVPLTTTTEKSNETVPESTGSTLRNSKIWCISTVLYLLTHVYSYTHYL